MDGWLSFISLQYSCASMQFSFHHIKLSYVAWSHSKGSTLLNWLQDRQSCLRVALCHHSFELPRHRPPTNGYPRYQQLGHLSNHVQTFTVSSRFLGSDPTSYRWFPRQARRVTISDTRLNVQSRRKKLYPGQNGDHSRLVLPTGTILVENVAVSRISADTLSKLVCCEGLSVGLRHPDIVESALIGDIVAGASCTTAARAERRVDGRDDGWDDGRRRRPTRPHRGWRRGVVGGRRTDLGARSDQHAGAGGFRRSCKSVGGLRHFVRKAASDRSNDISFGKTHLGELCAVLFRLLLLQLSPQAVKSWTTDP